MTDNSHEYEVGYKRPPKHFQFKEGHSGNPKGRPKGSKNLRTVLDEIFNQKVQIHQGGNSYQVTIIEAIVRRLANDALNGDKRAADLLIRKWVNYFPELADPKDNPKLKLVFLTKDQDEYYNRIKKEDNSDDTRDI